MSKVIKQILSTHLSSRYAKISKSSNIIVFACAIIWCAGSCSYANLESIIDVGVWCMYQKLWTLQIIFSSQTHDFFTYYEAIFFFLLSICSFTTWETWLIDFRLYFIEKNATKRLLWWYLHPQLDKWYILTF